MVKNMFIMLLCEELSLVVSKEQSTKTLKHNAEMDNSAFSCDIQKIPVFHVRKVNLPGDVSLGRGN